MPRLPPINRRVFDNTAAPFSSDTNRDDTRARQLRKEATPAEQHLWFVLRQLRHRGFHFRREAPIEWYIVDFVCHRAKLIVELDGSQHAEPERQEYDARRTQYLNSCGYRVLRFWNDAVMQNRPTVVDAILWALDAA